MTENKYIKMGIENMTYDEEMEFKKKKKKARNFVLPMTIIVFGIWVGSILLMRWELNMNKFSPMMQIFMYIMWFVCTKMILQPILKAIGGIGKQIVEHGGIKEAIDSRIPLEEEND